MVVIQTQHTEFVGSLEVGMGGPYRLYMYRKEKL